VRTLPVLLAVASSLAAIAAASPARAEASAWVFVGGGGMLWKQFQDVSYNPAGTFIVDVGAGSSPDGRVIIGGLFRFQPVFPYGGVDMSLLTRFCTHGFQAGDWGVAIDAGGFGRYWGNQSVGFSGSVSLGMPLGFTLMAQTELGVDHAYTYSVVGGIDLLRLTIYRQLLLNWWQNPTPAFTPAQTASGGASLHF
jgi:hypothetical protein